MTAVLGLAEAKQPWFWGIAGVIALSLLLLNVLVLVAVHLRRIRQFGRSRREKRFRAELDEMFAELDPETRARHPDWLRARLGRFDELQGALAAAVLIERMVPATPTEREHTLDTLREAGAVELILPSLRRRMAWRRALAIRTLGWIGAEETVPALIDRLSDRSRYVRESAVRALGRIGDSRALPVLADLFRSPGAAGPGVVYDALIGFGGDARPVFAGALRSEIESVRVASCFGIAAVGDQEAGRLLEPLLDDPSARVRSAAAESLGQVGGDLIPEGLARASRDEQPAVRVAATGALGSYDDPHAVELALNALVDPDRDTAVRAGEALVRLSRRSHAGQAATHALQRSAEQWPVERALTFASLGVVT